MHVDVSISQQAYVKFSKYPVNVKHSKYPIVNNSGKFLDISLF